MHFIGLANPRRSTRDEQDRTSKQWFTTMYTVIGVPQSRAGRVIWMLEELGEAYDHIPARPHDEAVKRYNPSGKIPVLLDDMEVVLDSVAICQYLADKHGRLTTPPGTIARARQDSFTQFGADDLETPLWTATKNSFVLPAEWRVKAIKPTCNWEFGRALETLSRRLGDRPFVMGDEICVADIIIGQCLLWSRAAKFDPPPEPVAVYLERLTARPAFQRAKAKGIA